MLLGTSLLLATHHLAPMRYLMPVGGVCHQVTQTPQNPPFLVSEYINMTAHDTWEVLYESVYVSIVAR